MVKLTKEIRQEMEEYYLDCINDYDNPNFVLKGNKDKLTYLYNRFKSEFNHEIKRFGEFKAFSNWLRGLAIDIDFYNWDILELSKKWGQNPTTEKQEDKLISQWWDFSTNQYFKLFKKYKIKEVV